MDDAPGRNGPLNGRRRPRDNRQASSAESFARLYERPLPYSLEAEMALLGSLLLDPKVAPDVMSIVGSTTDFYSETHGAIYQAVIDVYDKIPDADLVDIVDCLRDRDHLEQIGGPDYLSKLAYETPTAAGALRYAKIVADKAKLRKLIDAADQIIYDSLNAGQYGLEGAREVIDTAESLVFEIAQEGQKSDLVHLADLLQEELDRIAAAEGKGISGLPTGYSDLDKLTSGFQPGEMIIIAARPSMGKTALTLNIAEQVARGGITPDDAPKGGHIPVGVFSLEMSKASLVQRMLSAFSQVDSHKMRTGHLSQGELESLKIHAEGLAETPIYIDDTPGLTVLQLRARARRMVAQYGVKIIMIDYLQLLSAPGSSRDGRQNEVAAISRGVKALARELNIPVIVLSQLNRASEQREGNRPRMSDLRESGSIEQDADVVMLLHREDYYHIQDPDWAAQNPDKVNTAELIMAKQRNGPTGTVTLTWDNKTTRFKNHHPAYGGGFGGGYDYAAGNAYGATHTPFSAPPASPASSGPSNGPANGPPGGQAYGSLPPSPFDTVEPKSPPPPAPTPSRSAFPARPPTGPINNHRDGGGPDKDFDEGELPPF
jgi:replicative DNA helicase